ncbi:MAG: hypothetical protein A2Y17_03095 [Clostridiales bacterium GWF2_38_85]|nr:MAG: hypothetical protein A2Y17_03095 [Clostridiales bacterium GWF2_38_85]
MEFKNNKLILKNKKLAFSVTSDITLTFLLDRDICPTSAKCVLKNDNTELLTIIANDCYLDKEFICYDVSLQELSIGLYFFEFYVYTEVKTFQCNELILIYNNLNIVKAINNGIVYHIFIDRFSRGGCISKRTDAVYFDDWYNTEPEFGEYPGDYIPNNSFFGGTIYGIIEKLDYIKSLGTSCIYLSPVFESYSNHKYDTGDYMKVDEGFGGDKALKKLIDKAKEKDISIILDCAFNHTGDDSVYFNKYGKYSSLGAYQSQESPYYSWYNFREYPDVYDCWWGVKILPKTVRTETFKNFICNNVLPKYFDMGITGIRLDVTDELEDELLGEINSTVKKYNGVIIGEVWEDASNKIAYGNRKKYFLGNELDGVTNYPLREGIINFILTKNNTQLIDTINTLELHYPDHCLYNSLNFLGSHDTNRIITILSGISGEGIKGSELTNLKLTLNERSQAKNLLKFAFLLLLTMKGTPCIYYGDEIGMEGYRDPFNRRPYPWGKEDNDILEWTKTLCKLRNTEKISGAISFIETRLECIAYQINKNFICVVNLSENDEIINLDGYYSDLITEKIYKDNYVIIKSNSCILIERIIKNE